MGKLIDAHGNMAIGEFTSQDLACLRDVMVMIDGSTPRRRGSVNVMTGIIRQAFQWVAENGHV